MSVKTNTVSKAGYEKLQADLDYLVTVRRGEVAEKLKEARSFGDLSENAEYDEAKNEQGILEARIAELENIIANAVVVDDDDISVTEVSVGSIVKIRDLEFDEIEELQIVGSTESDPDNHKSSDESPIGKALVGHVEGDVIEVETPSGLIGMKIVEVGK